MALPRAENGCQMLVLVPENLGFWPHFAARPAEAAVCLAGSLAAALSAPSLAGEEGSLGAKSECLLFPGAPTLPPPHHSPNQVLLGKCWAWLPGGLLMVALGGRELEAQKL